MPQRNENSLVYSGLFKMPPGMVLMPRFRYEIAQFLALNPNIASNHPVQVSRNGRLMNAWKFESFEDPDVLKFHSNDHAGLIFLEPPYRSSADQALDLHKHLEALDEHAASVGGWRGMPCQDLFAYHWTIRKLQQAVELWRTTESGFYIVKSKEDSTPIISYSYLPSQQA